MNFIYVNVQLAMRNHARHRQF